MEFDASGITNPNTIAQMKQRMKRYREFRKMIIEEIVPFAFESDEGYAVVGGRASDKPNFTISDSLEVRAVFCHTCRELRVPHCIDGHLIYVFPIADVKTLAGFDGKKD